MRHHIGETHGNWQIVATLFRPAYNAYKFKCLKCGHIITDTFNKVINGKRSSCYKCKITNCSNEEKRSLYGNYKHGYRNTKIYEIWKSMKGRCYTKSNTSYCWYGDRGIKVCRRWHKFENFLKDMGIPLPRLELDRIDNNNNYCPANCRWVTRVQNSSNRNKIKKPS